MKDEKQSINDISGESEFPWSKIALLEMVITVVGEVYGQRDLLEARTCWPNGIESTQDGNLG
jgi:hypothetical protein